MGGTDKMPFDWEIPQPSAVRQSRPLPSLIDLAFVSLLTGKGMDQKWIMADKFAQLDSKIRLKMFEFLLRLNEGDLPQVFSFVFVLAVALALFHFRFLSPLSSLLSLPPSFCFFSG